MHTDNLLANTSTADRVVATGSAATVPDTTAPRMVSVSATVDGPLTIVFDEAIQVRGGRLSLIAGNYSMTLELIDMTGPAVTVSGNTLTYTPDHLLAVRSYNVSLNTGNIADASGNLNIYSLSLGPFEINTLRNGDTAVSGLGAETRGRVMGTDANMRDTAVFPRALSDFTFTKTETGYTVPIPPGGYSVELTSIERALFTESKDALALSMAGNLGQVYRLYQAAFDRTPDKIGFGFWLAVSDAGQTLTAISQSFIDSAEFTDLYGAGTSNTAFVDALYDNILHRDGDATGVAFWNGVLDHGTSRADVLVEFAESMENRAQLADVIGNGFAYTPYG
jgi:hypothetical protein